MNTEKIGSFLKQLRKENGMTQEQLGERIGTTNKTISRWETGNYMPPVECLMMLSDIYEISINEILAGERISKEKLNEIADENITMVLGELQKKNYKFNKRMWVIYALITALAMGIIILLPQAGIGVYYIGIIAMVALMWFLSVTAVMVAIVSNRPKEERERRYYNRKLFKTVFKSEMRQARKSFFREAFEWQSLLITMIGIILADNIIDAMSLENFIRSVALEYVIKFIIWVVTILAVQFIAGALKRAFGKRDNGDDDN